MENQYEIERTFQVTDGCRLEVQNISGSTQVDSWDRQEVRVLAHKEARSPQSDEATEIQISQEGNTVYVKTRSKWEGDWLRWLSKGMHSPARVDYLIKVPAKCHVSTSMVSGATRVANLEGTLRLNTVSGDATLIGISGSVSLNSVSGDIEANELSGELRLNTVSGDMVVKASNLSSLQGNTVSGDVRIETPLDANSHYGISSVSGDVRFTVPSDARLTAKLSTVSGSLRTSLPYDVLENRRGLKRYAINGGGASLDAQSVSGDLRIVTGREEGVATQPAARPEPAKAVAAPVAQDDDIKSYSTRIEVLKAIESGEISVQEGLARLTEFPEE